MSRKLGIGGHQSATMRTDEWLTPPEIVAALGKFDLDPCSPINRPWPTAEKHYTIEDDGLFLPWFGRVWMNPPYGKQMNHWLRISCSRTSTTKQKFVRYYKHILSELKKDFMQQIEKRTDCPDFEAKAFPNDCGECQTDGHYLCVGCKEIASFDNMELHDNRMRYYEKQEMEAEFLYKVVIDTGWQSNGFRHLVANDIKTLHAFAEKIGVNRCWFENKTGRKQPHYDIKGEYIERALKAGAVEVDPRYLIKYLKNYYA